MLHSGQGKKGEGGHDKGGQGKGQVDNNYDIHEGNGGQGMRG